jgi:hypothetical protein
MPSPSPLAPVLSHAAGEDGGDERSGGDPAPVTDTAFTHPSPAVRERAGGEGARSAGGPSPSLPDPLSLPQEERKGGRAERGRSCACHRYRVYTPLSRSAGEGLGVRVPRSAGGPSPSLPDPLSLPQEERKGGRAERGRSCACHRYRVYTPLSRSAGEGWG